MVFECVCLCVCVFFFFNFEEGSFLYDTPFSKSKVFTKTQYSNTMVQVSRYIKMIKTKGGEKIKLIKKARKKQQLSGKAVDLMRVFSLFPRWSC